MTTGGKFRQLGVYVHTFSGLAEFLKLTAASFLTKFLIDRQS